MTQLDPGSPANVLAARFWEAILAEDPTTATMYGDERYDDRLEDPGPEGRARRRALMERTLAEVAAIDADGQSLEDRITLDMIGVVCRLGIVQDEQRTDLLRVVDQMAGPQTSCPRSCRSRRPTRPSGSSGSRRACAAYGGYMAANADLLREGVATGLTAPRIVAERTIAQLERLLETPPEASVDHDRRPGRLGGGPGADRGDRARRRHAGRPGVPRGAQGRLPGGQPRGPGPLVRARRRRPLPDPDPRLDDARGAIPRRSTGSASRSSSRSRRSAGRSPARPASATTPSPTGRPSPPSRRTSRRSPEELLDRARDGHRPGARPRAALLRPPAPGRLRRPGRRVVQGEGQPVRLLHPADDRRLAGRDLLRQHLRPAVADLHEARLDDLPRGGPRPSLPDRPRDGEREPQRLPAARLADGRRAPTSRAGASTPSGSPTRWGCTATTPSGSGCSTGRPGGPPGSSSTAGSTRCAGRASGRSTRSSAPGLTPTDATIETDRYIAWPGQALTYKLGQREIERLRRRDLGPRRRRLRPARLPRRGPRPRLAAARDARPRAAELGRNPGVGVVPARSSTKAAPVGPPPGPWGLRRSLSMPA